MKTYAFIDASNLFYGGEKSLGWKIDYSKLIKYLKERYEVSEVYYFGGVETHGFKYDYLKNDTVPLDRLKKRLEDYISNEGKKLDEAKLILLSRHLSRIKFYLKLQEFDYKLYLKKEKANFDRVIVLSGDGDFLPVLKHLKEIGKEVIILARGPRTAREIRQFAGSNFRDFVRLENDIKFEEKK